MAEANVSDTGSSIDVPTPDEFSSLDQFHQREAYKRLYGQHRMCNAEAKCNHTEELQAVRSQWEGGPDTSSPVDQTLVGRQSANAYEKSLLQKSLTAKEVRNTELENQVNAVSKDKQNIAEKLQNATKKIGEMQSMLNEKEKELSASKAQCRALTLQVANLHVELEDREDMIHTMTESAQRNQEQNAELFAQLEVLQTEQERPQGERQQLAEVCQENARLRQQALRNQEQNAELFAQLEVLQTEQERAQGERQQLAEVCQENARLRQQLEEELRQNEILRNLVQMIARRSLRLHLPDAEVSMEMLE